MERKLVTIRMILDIVPIEKADRIEIAKIDGWQVVVKKDEFKVGDKVVYFEIDSFIPVDEKYEFLRKSSYKQLSDGREGFRIKTVKLRGALSQGLVEKVPEQYQSLEVGTDLTEEYKVVKYEPKDVSLSCADAKGNFPAFIPKTDAERIQNISFEEYKYHTYEVTEKLDGTSCTIYFNNGEFGVCSRNLELKYDVSSPYWKMAIKYDLEKKLRTLNRNIAIQGEIVGPGIQGNHYVLYEIDFFIFNIFDIHNQKYIPYNERCILQKDLELKSVPFILFCDINSQTTKDMLLSRSNGKSILNQEVLREGLVFKDWENPSFNFKAISNEYLLGEQ